MAPTTLLFLSLGLSTLVMDTDSRVSGAETLSKYSGILIFGDSTVDTGNNNYVQTIFRGNHPPYGQDFPNHIPTGRFSNGKLIPDFTASLLGIKETVPPILDPSLTDDDIRTGVCFASAGSGYDNLTTLASNVIPMFEQLELFKKNYIPRLNGIVGEDKAKKMISSSVVIVSSGTNDMIDNYYDIPTRKHQFSISGYHDFLLDCLQNFVKELYSHGGRSMIIAGLPPIGCLPVQRTTRYGKSGELTCVEEQNSDSHAYNQKLTSLLAQLQSSLPGSRLVYANIYDPVLDMVSQPQKYGFTETQRGCCGTGLVEAGTLCNEMTPTCGRASQFMFWDAIHPTESTYSFIMDYLKKVILS